MVLWTGECEGQKYEQLYSCGKTRNRKKDIRVTVDTTHIFNFVRILWDLLNDTVITRNPSQDIPPIKYVLKLNRYSSFIRTHAEYYYCGIYNGTDAFCCCCYLRHYMRWQIFILELKRKNNPHDQCRIKDRLKGNSRNDFIYYIKAVLVRHTDSNGFYNHFWTSASVFRFVRICIRWCTCSLCSCSKCKSYIIFPSGRTFYINGRLYLFGRLIRYNCILKNPLNRREDKSNEPRSDVVDAGFKWIAKVKISQLYQNL